MIGMEKDEQLIDLVHGYPYPRRADYKVALKENA